MSCFGREIGTSIYYYTLLSRGLNLSLYKYAKLSGRSVGASLRQNFYLHPYFWYSSNECSEEHSGSVGRVLDLGSEVTSSRLMGDTVLCPWARHFILCLVLVQPRKTGKCPYMAEKLLTGM